MNLSIYKKVFIKMEFTKDELIKWFNSRTKEYSINPKTNRKINNSGPTYKKLEKEYNMLFIENTDNYDFETNIKNINLTDKNNIENKFVLYLELKDTKKIKIQEYKILNILEYKNGCSCEQKIEIKLNEKNEIKEDVINILKIIKNEYNDKEIQKIYGLDYDCKTEELDNDGNVFGFIFNTNNQNIEFPIIPVHCYSNIKRKTIEICIHIQYLSFYNHYNNESYDYETHLLIRY
jgi:hypothetical protein